MKNKIIVAYSSHLSNEYNEEFNKHIDSTIGTKYEIAIIKNFNQYSLSEAYNMILEKYTDSNIIIVFIHNDIVFKTKNWGKKILYHFNNSDYGIIGVAGTTFLSENGVWWNDASKMYGIVEHTNGITNWDSTYSDEINGIQEVVTIDGVFMAVNPTNIVSKFNTNYGKFHFYDITFCTDNYFEDVRIGVISDVRVLHKSIGETDNEWDQNRLKFVEEYKDELPVRIVPEKIRVLLTCQFFKNYTGSELANFELAKELVKMGRDVTIVTTVTGEPLYSQATKLGIKVHLITEAPNFRMVDNNKLAFNKNEKEFDVIHINHKPIGEQVLKMYPNTPAVMHIHSEVIPKFEEPILNNNIKRYISIRPTVREYIKTYNISDDKIVDISNPIDITRFNTDYEQVVNDKKIVLFVGTYDYLRLNALYDLVEVTKQNNQILWLIGSHYESAPFINEEHVKYFGVKSNVEDYVKKCDYTAGIFKGRTTIEGFLCGKPGWIYDVDKAGNVLNKRFSEVPENLDEYRSDVSAKKVSDLYDKVIDETWFQTRETAIKDLSVDIEPEKNENKMGILMVNYNNLYYTKNAVNDIINQNNQNFSLWLFDQNSSEAGTSEYLDSINHPNIRVIKNKENTDLNRVWNYFYDNCNLNYLCFLNNDVRLTNNFVDDTLKIFNKENNVGSVIHVTNNPLYSSASKDLNYEILNPPLYQGWDFTIRRDIYVRVPDTLRIYGGDDYIFGWIVKNNYNVALTYSSPIIHYKEKTSDKVPMINNIQKNDEMNYWAEVRKEQLPHVNITYNTEKCNKYAIENMKLNNL